MYFVGTLPKTRTYSLKHKRLPVPEVRRSARTALSFLNHGDNAPQEKPQPTAVELVARLLKAELVVRESVAMFISLIFGTRPIMEE